MNAFSRSEPITAAEPPVSSQFANSRPPTPLPEIVAALKRVAPLHGLLDSEYEWLATHGVEIFAPAGSTLFHEGDPATKMMVILRGEVQVRRSAAAHSTLFIGRAGQITALLPFSRMKSYGGHGFTTADTWALEYDRSLFPDMLQAIPSFGQRIVSVLLDRVREVTRIQQQAEKLTALGKLAANLAHELNNPASAAQRAASGLMEELQVFGNEKFRWAACASTESQAAKIDAWESSLRRRQRLRTRCWTRRMQSQREDLVTQLARSEGHPGDLADCARSG